MNKIKNFFNRYRNIVIVSFSNIVEFYDFSICLFFAADIGRDLIPVNNPTINLIASFLIFALASFFRIIGGLIFAHFGDRFGRKSIFSSTIILMSIVSILAAFIPHTSYFGIYSTILLIILRIIQSMTIGGEISGSIVFAYESVEEKYRPIAVSMIILGSNFGLLFAILVCNVLNIFNFSIFDFSIANWRLAFIFGGILGLINYYFRKNLLETNDFIVSQKLKIQSRKIPIKQVLSNYKSITIQMIALGIGVASVSVVFSYYLPTYLKTFCNISTIDAMNISLIGMVLATIGNFLSAFIYNSTNKKTFLFLLLLILIFAVVLFNIYHQLSVAQIMLINMPLYIIIGLFCGRLSITIPAMFPTAIRYSAVAMIYNTCFGIIGAISPAIITALIEYTSILSMPAIYIGFFAIITTYVLIRYIKFKV